VPSTSREPTVVLCRVGGLSHFLAVRQGRGKRRWGPLSSIRRRGMSCRTPLIDGLVANLRAAPLSSMDTSWLLV
jgi:hypothetical protein